MKKALLFSIILLLLPFQTITYANESKTTEDSFNIYMDKALQFVKTQQYEEAFHVVSFLDRQLVDENLEYRNEDKNFISVVFTEVSRLSDDPSNYHEEIIHNLTKARLYTDSINNQENPLWKNYDKTVFYTINSLREAAESGNDLGYQQQVNMLIKTYNLLYPSMIKHVKDTRMIKLDNRMTELDINRSELLLTNEWDEAIEVIHADLEYAFYGLEQDEADPSLWWVIITTGSIIILTLSYVGWRKYKADKMKVEEPARYKNK